VELVTHADDAVGHALDLGLPLTTELRVGKNGASNTSTVERWVGVHRADNDLQLALYTSLLLCVGGHDGECTNTLAIETHVLGERLAQRNLVALRDKVAGSKSISGDVTRGEALVSHVKEGEELLLVEEARKLLPLSLGRVNTSGVVGTGVEKDDGVLRGVLQLHNEQGESNYWDTCHQP
jgi:hypothetical protein